MSDLSHRPWPAPARPWVMSQVWHDLLFMHWQVPADVLTAHIPPGLTLDLYEGIAWVAVVPFWMSGITPRFMPAVSGLSRFPELNVRTYVTQQGNKPGVWFLSLDAANAIAVRLARWWFNLPYLHATMQRDLQGEKVVYHSVRTDASAATACLTGEYQPTGEPYYSTPGTLAHWLTSRYCLYTTDANGKLLRGEIQHLPWPLQNAQAHFSENTYLQAHGIPMPSSAPLLHFSKRLDVVVWGLEAVT